MNIESEIEALKRRVGDLEGAVNVLAGQVRNIDPMMTFIREETNRRYETTDRLLERMLQRLDTINTQVWSIRDDLPVLLDEALSRNTGTGQA